MTPQEQWARLGRLLKNAGYAIVRKGGAPLRDYDNRALRALILAWCEDNQETTMDITFEIDEYGAQYNQVQVILDPAKRKVYTFGQIGAGTPGPVWHGRHRVIASLRPDFVGETLEDVLRGHESDLAAVADAYLGDEWDGSNHVGRWAEDVADLVLPIEDSVEHGDAVARYWDAGDYLAGDTASVIANAFSHKGIGAAAAAEVADAKSNGAHIRLDDAEKYIRSLVEERIDDLVDDEEDHDDDDDDAKALAKLRALLGSKS